MLHHKESEEAEALRQTGWRNAPLQNSLPEVFRSIPVPQDARWFKRLLAFVGPGYLIAVGYMDPGNWATDIAAGSKFKYTLLSVVLMSSLMAMFLQALSAKLGIVTRRDLAQACRDGFGKPVNVFLWISAEIAIAACDIAEVIGAAIALNLLFGIPLAAGVLITSLDVLLVLALQHRSFRAIEALVILLIGSMMGIFVVELVFARPDWFGAAGVASGFKIHTDLFTNREMLYIGLSILGATVMPHNLYLHSSIVQTRHFDRTSRGLRDAIRLAYTDSHIALVLAFIANASILILAASVFYRSGHHEVADIQAAYKLLTPILAASLATPLFAVALLASGQNSTLTGTMAGQVILEGFTSFKIKPWLRRLISRCIAIVPAIIAVIWYGESGTGKLLIFSQVILSMQLAFAVGPLVYFTNDRVKMGEFANSRLTAVLGWITTAVVFGLNCYLVVATLRDG